MADADFKTLVSPVSIARKPIKAARIKYDSPVLFAGSHNMRLDDQAVSRRLVLFPFLKSH